MCGQGSLAAGMPLRDVGDEDSQPMTAISSTAASTYPPSAATMLSASARRIGRRAGLWRRADLLGPPSPAR